MESVTKYINMTWVMGCTLGYLKSNLKVIWGVGG
jgi:hypothetical protein